MLHSFPRNRLLIKIVTYQRVPRDWRDLCAEGLVPDATRACRCFVVRENEVVLAGEPKAAAFFDLVRRAVACLWRCSGWWWSKDSTFCAGAV